LGEKRKRGRSETREKRGKVKACQLKHGWNTVKIIPEGKQVQTWQSGSGFSREKEIGKKWGETNFNQSQWGRPHGGKADEQHPHWRGVKDTQGGSRR